MRSNSANGVLRLHIHISLRAHGGSIVLGQDVSETHAAEHISMVGVGATRERGHGC